MPSFGFDTTRISLWKWCRYKGGRSIGHNGNGGCPGERWPELRLIFQIGQSKTQQSFSLWQAEIIGPRTAAAFSGREIVRVVRKAVAGVVIEIKHRKNLGGDWIASGVEQG